VTRNGKQKSLGVHDPSDEAGAWAALQDLDKLKGMITEAVAAANSGQSGYRPEPLAELITVYLDTFKHRFGTGALRWMGIVLNAFGRHFPDSTAQTADPLAIERQAASQPWSNSYRRMYLSQAQNLIRWAGRKDFKLRLPPKEARGAEATIDEKTHLRILELTKGDFRQLCRFCWCMGCRPGEAAGLTVEGTDWANGVIALQKHKTRHKGQSRILYLSQEALTIMTEQREKHKEGALFRGNRDRQLTPHAIQMRLWKMSKKHLGRRTFAYGYRHGFCTRGVLSGIHPKMLAELLGHKSTAMIDQVYAHVGAHAQALREAANRVS
jgi:integrase